MIYSPSRETLFTILIDIRVGSFYHFIILEGVLLMSSRKPGGILNLNLSRKLLLFPVIAVVFFSILMAISYTGLRTQKEAISDIYNQRFSLYQGASTMANETLDVYANTYKLISMATVKGQEATISSLGKEQLDKISKTIEYADSILNKNKFLTAEERKLYEQTKTALMDCKKEIQNVIDIASGDVNTAVVNMTTADDKYKVFNKTTQGLIELENKLSREKYNYSEKSSDLVIWMSLGVFISGAILLFIASIIISKAYPVTDQKNKKHHQRNIERKSHKTFGENFF